MITAREAKILSENSDHSVDLVLVEIDKLVKETAQKGRVCTLEYVEKMALKEIAYRTPTPDVFQRRVIEKLKSLGFHVMVVTKSGSKLDHDSDDMSYVEYKYSAIQVGW